MWRKKKKYGGEALSTTSHNEDEEIWNQGNGANNLCQFFNNNYILLINYVILKNIYINL